VIILTPFFLSALSTHADDIALLIYTVALVIWGWVFALVLRKKWGIWRYRYRHRLTLDEWMLIGLMLIGLVLGLVCMITFLHGRPPGVRLLIPEGLILSI
jgi:cytochrome c biogenesis protein CcdA